MEPVSPVTFAWRGLTLGPDPFCILKDGVKGWLDLPDVSRQTTPSAFGHGWSPSAGVMAGRSVTVRGFIRATPTTRDSLVAQLRAAFTANASTDDSTELLVGTMVGETATADAQLDAWDVDIHSHSSMVPWSAMWTCPDPFKYLDWISTTVSLVAPTGGDTLPQTLGFVMDAQPLGGRATIVNPGTNAEGSPARFTLVGGQSGTPGVQVIHPSGRVVTVTYPFTLAANRGDGLPDTLVIDTARGGAYLNGEYRSPNPGPDVVADLRLPPGSSVVQALGTTGSGSPSMQVEVRPSKS